MGNALVTIDTGLALFKLPFQGMPFAGGFILDFEIHRFQCVAVTAFPRIRRGMTCIECHYNLVHEEIEPRESFLQHDKN